MQVSCVCVCVHAYIHAVYQQEVPGRVVTVWFRLVASSRISMNELYKWVVIAKSCQVELKGRWLIMLDWNKIGMDCSLISFKV